MINLNEIKKTSTQLGYAMAVQDALKESVNIGGERGFGADKIVNHLETKLKELMDEHSNPEEEVKGAVKQ